LKPARWLKPDEAQRLVDACGAQLRPLVIFMLGAGCRIGKALRLDWRQVDLNRAHVTFPRTKNGAERHRRARQPQPSRCRSGLRLGALQSSF
jgi:integrase